MLQGKVAAVTGGGRGIGRAIALAMAKEGAKVVVNDIGCSINGTAISPGPANEVVEEVLASGGIAVANFDTVATMEGAEKIIKTATDKFGTIDILVNVAGIQRNKLIWEMTEEDWDSVIAVHLKGTFACTKFASLVMMQQKSGHIINFLSTAGLIGMAGEANCSAANGAVASLTKIVARDLGPYGITVNAVAPFVAARNLETADMVEWSAHEDFAPLAIYLASDKATNINGQIFGIQGGKICLYSYPRPIRIVQIHGNWTPRTIAIAHYYTEGQPGFGMHP